MPFIKLPGIEGWVFEPEIKPESQRKHNCPDCFFCQMCSNIRCQSCRKEKAKAWTKTNRNNKTNRTN